MLTSPLSQRQCDFHVTNLTAGLMTLLINQSINHSLLRQTRQQWDIKNKISNIYTVVHKKQDTILLSISSPNNRPNRFSKFFHFYTQQKICNKTSLQFPPHLNGVATIPCEILMSDNIACPMLGDCFLKYKLVRDMTYDRQQLL